MRMTLQQQRDIIDAAIRGEEIEFCFMAGDKLWSKHNAPMFDFTRYTYRVKPPELRPHWPAVVVSSKPDGTIVYSVSNMLFAKPEDLIGKDGALRLATEYPPVMLP